MQQERKEYMKGQKGTTTYRHSTLHLDGTLDHVMDKLLGAFPLLVVV